MSIILITIYCLMAAMFIFGLTFHDELVKEKERKRKVSLTVIDGGRPFRPRLRRHV